ncbi:MAG: radical SAM family heme chaperone HemW [Candidatus Omnitrophota bacterium]
MQQKNKMKLDRPGTLYVHIPFCERKCAYCDFYSVAYDGDLASSYVDVLIAQVKEIEAGVSSIFIGGGTPTALSTPLLKKLLRGTRRLAGKGVEFTVEANPESLSVEKLNLFSDEGVNRLSIGVQSFSDAKLKKLGRIHDAGKAIDAVILSKKRGFDNLSIDLIFGAPGETLDDCSAEFARAVKLPVTHISCYCLTCEAIPTDEENSARMYCLAMEYLPARGFRHYEVSNFAKKGFECAHNLNYWRNGEYIGLGASAVSYTGGVRGRHTPDVKEYIKRSRAGESTVVSSEQLGGDRKARETAAVKIRTAEGIDFYWFKKKTGFDFIELEGGSVARLVHNGLIKRTRNGIRLTRRGFMHCDSVSSELL